MSSLVNLPAHTLSTGALPLWPSVLVLYFSGGLRPELLDMTPVSVWELDELLPALILSISLHWLKADWLVDSELLWSLWT